MTDESYLVRKVAALEDEVSRLSRDKMMLLNEVEEQRRRLEEKEKERADVEGTAGWLNHDNDRLRAENRKLQADLDEAIDDVHVTALHRKTQATPSYPLEARIRDLELRMNEFDSKLDKSLKEIWSRIAKSEDDEDLPQAPFTIQGPDGAVLYRMGADAARETHRKAREAAGLPD